MIDYHCHILPGIDDGSESLEESVEMARLLSRAGYTKIYCTPHLIENLYEASNDTVRQLIERVQETLDRESIELTLLFGREYMIDDSFQALVNRLEPLENTSDVLIEFMPDVYPGMVRDSIAAIIRKGLRPMIAHPERYLLFQEKKRAGTRLKKRSLFGKWFSGPESEEESSAPDYSRTGKELLEWLASQQCAFQGNLLSFEGVYGEAVQRAALRLRELGLYTHTGTDSHAPEQIEVLFGASEPRTSAGLPNQEASDDDIDWMRS
jgi:protein-tyrosine phosphatase